MADFNVSVYGFVFFTTNDTYPGAYSRIIDYLCYYSNSGKNNVGEMVLRCLEMDIVREWEREREGKSKI